MAEPGIGRIEAGSFLAGLRESAIEGIDRLRRDVERVGEPDALFGFDIGAAHMIEGGAEATGLLAAIGAVVPRTATAVYCIVSVDRDERAHEAIREFFAEGRTKGDGRSRDNRRVSPVLYVGSSRKMATRMREHLGFCSRSTFGLKLADWYPAAELPLRLVGAVYPATTAVEVVSALEDALWERLQPMFERKGAR